MIQYRTHQTRGDVDLDRVTQTLVELVRPRRVVLFGSRARGTARPDSDYDILLETETAVDRERLKAVRDALGELAARVDLKVRSVERFARGRDDPGTIDYHVAREGRELYRAHGVPASRRVTAERRVRESRPDGAQPPPASLPLWIEQAEQDFTAMEQLRLATPAMWDAICFHAHEAVEKLLKSAILATFMPPPRTHNLANLQAWGPESVRTNAALREHCAMLAEMFPKSRYPEDGPLGAEDADRAISAARAARTIVMDVIRPPLRS